MPRPKWTTALQRSRTALQTPFWRYWEILSTKHDHQNGIVATKTETLLDLACSSGTISIQAVYAPAPRSSLSQTSHPNAHIRTTKGKDRNLSGAAQLLIL